MKCLFSITLFFLFNTAFAQMASMRVYTVAGNTSTTALGDGGPATAACVLSTEGIWIDQHCNLYISDMDNIRIRKVDLASGIITSVAGGIPGGFSGDGGPAINAQIKGPYGLWVDYSGNVIFADGNNNRVRKIDQATGIITTIGGGGSSLGDGGPATDAQITYPGNVYGDKMGNLYIAGSSRIRKISPTGTITTIAGNGVSGLSGDGGPATAAQIGTRPGGMFFDLNGNLLFADRANSRIRKISSSGIITTVAGSTMGYSGDGGLATNAQLAGPIGLSVDYLNNIIIADNENDRIRKVDAKTGIITTIAGVGTSVTGSGAEGAAATAASIHPEFIYLDRAGNIYYSCFCSQIRKITNYNPGIPDNINVCGETEVISVSTNEEIRVYPNPATDELNISASHRINDVCIYDLTGRLLLSQLVNAQKVQLNTNGISPGIYLVKVNGTDVRRFVKE